MARGRMINRKTATSAKVASYIEDCGPLSGIFHHRLIAFLDINGCCRADPYWLKGEVMPRLSGVTPEDCRTYSAGLVEHGLAVLYEVDGMPFLHMPGFRGEQAKLRPDRETPDVPVPEGFDHASGTMPDTFRTPSGQYPLARAEVEGELEREGEVHREGEGKATSDVHGPSDVAGSANEPADPETSGSGGQEPGPDAADDEPGYPTVPVDREKRFPVPTRGRFDYPEAFEAIWEVWPERSSSEAKKRAYRPWRTTAVRDDTTPRELFKKAKAYVEECDATNRAPRFVKQVATFFGPDEHWRDQEPPDPNGVSPPEVDKAEQERIEKLQSELM